MSLKFPTNEKLVTLLGAAIYGRRWFPLVVGQHGRLYGLLVMTFPSISGSVDDMSHVMRHMVPPWLLDDVFALFHAKDARQSFDGHLAKEIIIFRTTPVPVVNFT